MGKVNEQDLTAIIEHIGNNLHVPQLVQQFDKSMLFSTDEQIVGQWVDNKPLYTKTINCGALPNATLKDITVATANTILVKRLDGYALRSSDGMSLELPRSNPILANNISVDIIENQSKLRITTGGDYSTFTESYITLYYTKVSDTALPYRLGNENDYSTEERMVGTWIDGKPIYQKTFHDDSWSATITNTPTDITIIQPSELSALNIDKIILNYGSARWNNVDRITLPFNVNHPGTLVISVDTPLFVTGLHLRGYRNANSSPIDNVYITILYTKTTD